MDEITTLTWLMLSDSAEGYEFWLNWFRGAHPEIVAAAAEQSKGDEVVFKRLTLEHYQNDAGVKAFWGSSVGQQVKAQLLTWKAIYEPIKTKPVTSCSSKAVCTPKSAVIEATFGGLNAIREK